MADLEGLVREAALQAVAQALGAGPSSRERPLASAKQRPSTKKAGAGAKVASPKKRIRRSAEDLERAADAIFDYVTKNPGKRAEEIKAALGIPTASWALPIKKLVDEGRLVAKGAKRSTTYLAK